MYDAYRAGGACPGEELGLEAVIDLQALHELPPLQEGGAAALPSGANILLVLSDKRLYSVQPLVPLRNPPTGADGAAGPGPSSLAAAEEEEFKVFDVEDATVDIMRLKGAKADLYDAQARLESLRSELEARLSRHAAAQKQVLCRAESSLQRQQLIRRREQLEAQVASELGALTLRCEEHRARSNALKRQKKALERVSSGGSLAQGPPELAANLEDIYMTLNTRRWQLVSCLAEVYCAAPILGEAFEKLKFLKNARRGADEQAGAPAGRNGSSSAGLARTKSSFQPKTNEAMGAALGYAASVVELLSGYLDIPVRYPVRCLGSKSVICDPALSPAVSNGALSEIQFPLFLHSHSAKEKSQARVDVGIFLLNKDIEQLLNAHGLEAQGLGRSAALTNLSRLVGAWDD